MRPLRFSYIIIFLSLTSILIMLFYEIYLLPPKVYREGEVVVIRRNQTASQIAHLLKEKGIISYPKWFVFLAETFGFERRLKRGRYLLKRGESEIEVLKRLAKGPSSPIFVTIPEGLTLKEIASLLEREGVVSKDEFLSLASNHSLLKSLGIPGMTCEGYLFPDTYDFPLESDPKRVIIRMVERFFRVYRELRGNIDSLKEVVILASLIEKEAKIDSERPIIASVFLNRLKRGLPLECDPTIQYILGKHKKRITYNDLKIPSPYNTYLHSGLPPGPICNPGRKSLEAALYPEETRYLYFVAKGDGSHYFSKTLSEHIRFKRLLKRRLR